jgi:hypothetical protein
MSAAEQAADGAESPQAQPSAPAGVSEGGTQPAASAASGGAPAKAQQTAEQIRAQWQADKVASDRAIREHKQLLKEREAKLAELEAKAAESGDLVKLFEKHPEKRKLYQEMTRRMVSADKDPTPEEKAAAEKEARLQALIAKDEARTAAEEKAAADAQRAASLKGVEAFYEANAAKYELTHALGATGYNQAMSEAGNLHQQGRRLSDDEVAEVVEANIMKALDGQLDGLLKSKKFRDLLQTKVAKQQPARQASKGDPSDDEPEDTVSPGIRTLSNALSSEPADEVDWEELPDHEIKRRTLAAARRARA